MRASALRAGHARPYVVCRTSGGERRDDHWLPEKAKRGQSALRADWGSFLNQFFSFSARKKRTVSNCQEKKEGKVRTVVLNLTQMISDSSCPSRKSLPPERSLRSAHRLSAELPSKANICGRTGSSAPTRCDARSRKRADEGIGPYRMVRIRKTPPDRHHPDSVQRGEVH